MSQLTDQEIALETTIRKRWRTIGYFAALYALTYIPFTLPFTVPLLGPDTTEVVRQLVRLTFVVGFLLQLRKLGRDYDAQEALEDALENEPNA